jgi:putative membrane protein
MSYAELGTLAAKRGATPETRAFGQRLVREQSLLYADLTRIATQEGLPIPVAMEERRKALSENLVTLPGRVFDRGFALAVAQDTGLMLRGFDQSRSSGDAQLKQLADRHQPVIEQERTLSNEILSRNGGSPFGFSPDVGAAQPF